MRIRWAAAAVIGSVALVLATGTTGARADRGRGTTIGDLPRGPDTTAAYLADEVIHADGTEITLPADIIEPEGSFQLLGPTPRGWAVVEEIPGVDPGGPDYAVYLVTDAGATKIHTFGGDFGFADYALGPAGRRILEFSTLEDSTDLLVLGLAGGSVGRGQVSNVFRLLDFDGRQVLFSTHRTTRLWRVGTVTAHEVAPDEAVFGDLHSGDLMLDRHRRHPTLDWTSLAHPRTTAWKARMTPTAINETRQRVVGRESPYQSTDKVVIRKVRTGKLVLSLDVSAVGTSSFSPRVWEDKDHVLFTARDPDGSYIVRCGVGGRCEVASPHYDSGISFPTRGP